MTHLASYVVSAAWQVPVLCAVGWVVARLLRRLGAATEHNVWELTLLLCVLIPAFPAPQARGHVIRVDIPAMRRSTSVSSNVGPEYSHAPIWLPRPALAGLSGLLLATALWSGFRLMRNYRRTRRIVQHAMPYALPPDHEAVWQQCLAAFGLRHVRVLSSTEISSPATVSFDGHALLLPHGMLDTISAQDFHAAAAHECAHMLRNDFRKHLFYSALAAPIAFHPLTRVLRRQLAATREMACDGMAAAVMGSESAYPAALLRLAAWVATTAQPRDTLALGAAMGIFDTNTLEERMKRLKSTARAVPAFVRVSGMVLAALCLCATATAAAIGAVLIAPAEATQQKFYTLRAVSITAAEAMAQPKVYTIGYGVTRPKLIHQVDPIMPNDPNARGGVFDGVCRVALVVGTDGVPQDVHVVKSLGKDYDANAIASVQQYRFQPGMHKGTAVPVALSIAINYRRF
jgi:beta-lactamase regulating signal transducer with metallopeptidase domain